MTLSECTKGLEFSIVNLPDDTLNASFTAVWNAIFFVDVSVHVFIWIKFFFVQKPLPWTFMRILLLYLGRHWLQTFNYTKYLSTKKQYDACDTKLIHGISNQEKSQLIFFSLHYVQSYLVREQLWILTKLVIRVS